MGMTKDVPTNRSHAQSHARRPKNTVSHVLREDLNFCWFRRQGGIEVVRNTADGFYKNFQLRVTTQSDPARYVVVQWVIGSLGIRGRTGKLEYVSLLHQGVDTAANFPNWEIDSMSQKAQYGFGSPSYQELGNTINLHDEPGVHGSGFDDGSFRERYRGRTIVANLEFIDNVYDRLMVSDNVSGFKNPQVPKPLLSQNWEFKGEYAVPNR